MQAGTNTTQHLAAGCVVLNPDKTKILVIFHKKLRKWLIPGGHVDPHEAPHEAAVREVREETGVAVTLVPTPSDLPEYDNGVERSLPLPLAVLREVIGVHGDTPAHTHVDFIYLAEAAESTLSPAHTEVADVRWVTLRELKAMDTFESIQRLAGMLLAQ